MKILVTGARGFLGRNLCEALRCIKDGKDRRERFGRLRPLELLECGSDTSPDELDRFCQKADFVFNFAGVNRPSDPADFGVGNRDYVEHLLALLEKHDNCCPVMLSSSVQASLEGRYAESEYGKSKLAAEGLLRDYGRRTGARALIYRFPNLFGKWCRPYYNSAVATFCHQTAHGQTPSVNDPSVVLDLLYVDDAVEDLLAGPLGDEVRDDEGFCQSGPIARVSLGEIERLLSAFREARRTLAVPDESPGSFPKKLHATYLSYLEPEGLSYPLETRKDERGWFAEFLRTPERGQVSVNVSAPGAVKGNHWHRTKWEKFLVVSGEAAIRLRRVGADASGRPFPTVEYRVSSERPEVVEMAPGRTHSIENLSGERQLVTVIWASEAFDPDDPDTYFEEV